MKGKVGIVLVLLTAFGAKMAQAQTVTFSKSGGFYDQSFALALQCPSPYHIRYTTNGKVPDVQSAYYIDSLFLDEGLYSGSDIYRIQTSIEELFYAPDSVQHCITLRVAAFDEEEQRVGEVVTQSYFIQALGCDTHGLPVMALAADSLDLFDEERGIFVPGASFDPENSYWTGNYYQSGSEWERCVNVEFYEFDNQGINQIAGVRTHGGTARRGPQKGLKLYARDEYGTKRFKHRFFSEIPNQSFKHLTLRPFSCHWFSTGIQDGICNRMARSMGVEAMASRPVALFLNGEYWGIYYVSERPDSHYLEDHFGFDDESYNVIGNWYGLEENGDATAFVQMMDWLRDDPDLTNDANYDYLCSLIDVNNFIDYYCLELFIANNDWPVNNMRCWQRNDSQWRWLFYDGDDCLTKMTFDVMGNATSEENLGWPTDARSTLLFRKLLENESFKMDFVARFHQLMGGLFSYEITKTYFDEAAEKVRDEVSQQAARFNKPRHLAEWNLLIADIDDFLSHRVDNMNGRLGEFFSVNDLLLKNSLIYPNPATNEDRLLLWSDGFAETSLEVYDMMGREIYASDLVLVTGENEIRIPCRLPFGLYLVKIGNSIKRIVIQ
ncbi:MAG: CotH kinase family protein [Bacteroidales bacterium]|nr:CotH kinase family protein [Bacteroidales bacterium]